MDFKSYITAIEKQLNQMTDAQRYDWIYAQARTIDEDKREKFLNSLSDTKQKMTELTVEEIQEWCDQVENGDIYLEAEGYDDYQENSWDPDWITEYHDNFGAMAFLLKAIKTCRQLIMLQEYETAYLLLLRICTLQFCTEYVGEEWCGDEEEEMELEELVEEGLVSIDLRDLALCLIYACYQTQKGQKRIQEIYEYLSWKMGKEVVFTDVMAFGPEMISHADAFMQSWCRYLVKLDGDRAAQLLLDASRYLGGEEHLLSVARENVQKHPSLYLEYCKRKYQSGEYISCIEISREAISQIEMNREIRADISDIGVDASERVNDAVGRKLFCQAAFASKPDSRRLLRLYEFDDKEVIQNALCRLESINAGPFHGNTISVELKETHIADKKLKEVFRFLLGDYEKVVQKCMEDKDSLGWSYSLKGVIVPLLMLSMKKDGDIKTKAESALIRKMEYEFGFKQKGSRTFGEYFAIWRKHFQIAEKHREIYMKWLSGEVDKRVEGVVGGGHRKSYYKAAELIVMLGALREEKGEMNGIYELVEHYKRMHSRKYAFRNEIDELKTYN